jgi:hypothetical protein
MGDEPDTRGFGSASAKHFERTAGGVALVVGGILLFGALLAIALLPAPPAALSGVVRWVKEHSVPLSLSDELMFFAIVLLTPALVILLRTLQPLRPVSSLIGCTSLLMAMAILGLMVVIVGRLVYPVFGIALSDDSTALIVSMLYGALHTFLLFVAAGLIALGFALWRGGVWRQLAVGSFAAGILQVLGAFPWLTPPWLSVMTTAALALWMVAVGLRLRRQ